MTHVLVHLVFQHHSGYRYVNVYSETRQTTGKLWAVLLLLTTTVDPQLARQ